MTRRSFSALFVPVFCIVAAALVAATIYAWTGPASSPPAGNVSAPVNVSSTSQVKSGGLWVGSLGVSGGVAINSGTVTALSITTSNESPWGLTIRNNTSSQRGIEIFQYNNGNSIIYNGYGSANQGYLQFGTGGYATFSPGICLGGVCRTSWPASASSLSQTYTSGSCSVSENSRTCTAVTSSCPSGYVRSGCSYGGGVPGIYSNAYPYGNAACACSVFMSSSGTVTNTCYAYCVK
jgi:hypothetical protein